MTQPDLELAYVGHPVLGDFKGTDPNEIAAVIASNLQRAKRWLRFLIHVYDDISFEMTWLNYIEVLREGRWRERGLRDDAFNASRCDLIVLCGGFLSSGMKIELQSVLLGRKPLAVPPTMIAGTLVHQGPPFLRSYTEPSRYVLDLLDMGDEPPPEESWTDPVLVTAMAIRRDIGRQRGGSWPYTPATL